MSVKLRITAWFTLMILVLMALVITFVFVVQDQSLASDPKNELFKVVGINASILNDEHEHKGDKNEDKLKTYHNGVYCSFYDESGILVKGALPEYVTYTEPFKNGNIAEFQGEADSFYIYDMYVSGDSDIVWIRGFISTDEPSPLIKTIIILTCTLLPLIFVISVFGGWLIARQSMKPLDEIIESVDLIKSGEDLSARLGVSRGPTEIKKLSIEFDSMFDRLEKSFIAEKQFASDVSHELKTPITVILGECHRSRKLSLTEDELKASISNIEKQGLQMSRLVEQLLHLTRLQQGTDRFPLERHNLSEFTDACIEDFKTSLNDDKVVKKCVPEEIYAEFNPDLMWRILVNLLDNAKKYTAENGEITVGIVETDSGIDIYVEDNGPGIEKESLELIWNRFWQADSSRSIDNGIGLGLSMVKEMAEFQGGYVKAESSAGTGTKITVHFNN